MDMKNVKLFLFILKFIFLSINTYANGMDSLLLSDVRVMNYELIENKCLSDIQIKEDFVQISDYSMPPLSKSLLKLKLENFQVSNEGLFILGKITIDNIFHLDSSGYLKSIKQDWSHFTNKPLKMNQVFYSREKCNGYVYLLLSNNSSMSTPLKSIDFLSEKKVQQKVLWSFIEELILVSVLCFLILIYSLISTVYKARAYVSYLFGLISVLAYSFYLYDLSLNSIVNEVLVRMFGLSLLFNYMFFYEKIKTFLNAKQIKIFVSWINSAFIFILVSIISVAFNFQYFFSIELFIWTLFLISGVIFLTFLLKQINGPETLLVLKMILFNVLMLIMISQYFNSISYDYLGIFGIGILTKELVMCGYYIYSVASLKISNEKKLDFIKQLKGNYNEEQKSKIHFRDELQNTEEKIVQNSMLVKNKEKLVLELENLLKSKLDKLNLVQIKPLLNEIQGVEKKMGFKQFDFHFQRVNQELYDKLLESYPQLLANDLKLCAFIRMNLNSKEIAAITGKSPSSIDVSKYRLRKKLEVASNNDLQILIASVFNESKFLA